MTHYRTTLRNTVQPLLAGAPKVGKRIYSHRVSPSEAPAINIMTGSDSAKEEYNTATAEGREVTLMVQIVVKETDDYMATCDLIAAYVETKILADLTLGGIAKHIEYAGTDDEASDELDADVAQITMLFEVSMRIARGDPNTIVQ